jgi:hypothetical protein
VQPWPCFWGGKWSGHGHMPCSWSSARPTTSPPPAAQHSTAGQAARAHLPQKHAGQSASPGGRAGGSPKPPMPWAQHHHHQHLAGRMVDLQHAPRATTADPAPVAVPGNLGRPQAAAQQPAVAAACAVRCIPGCHLLHCHGGATAVTRHCRWCSAPAGRRPAQCQAEAGCWDAQLRTLHTICEHCFQLSQPAPSSASNPARRPLSPPRPCCCCCCAPTSCCRRACLTAARVLSLRFAAWMCRCTWLLSWLATLSCACRGQRDCIGCLSSTRTCLLLCPWLLGACSGKVHESRPPQPRQCSACWVPAGWGCRVGGS